MSTEYLLLAGIPLLTLILYSRNRKCRLPLPPSPKSDPLIGHLRVLPSSDEHLAYRDLGVELQSDIISLNVLGQVIVVLNSTEATADLLSKRSSIYSDRPELPMLNDESLVGWGKNTGLMRYGERWRSQRTMTHSVLHRDSSAEIEPTMLKKLRLSLQRLLNSSRGIETELSWMTASIILSSLYGYEATPPDDNLFIVVEKAANSLSAAALPGNFYVNTIPWLKYVPTWFPGASWKRKARLWNAEREDMINKPYEWTKAQVAAGTAQPSMLKTLLTKLDTTKLSSSELQEQEDVMRWTTGTLFSAAADSTLAALKVFLLALILHPEVQARAQAELDSVLGGVRLPEPSDRDSLPYLNRVLREVMRWRPVGPLGIPHACTQDDEYKGYLIPKGAIVIGNVWAISNNPDTYPNPDSFNPDRFLDPSIPDPPAFGFGRRSCPGKNFAETVVFNTMATLLAIFNIKAIQDEEGRELLPKAEMKTNVLVSHPLPFDCSITPRSEKHMTLLNEWVEV